MKKLHNVSYTFYVLILTSFVLSGTTLISFAADNEDKGKEISIKKSEKEISEELISVLLNDPQHKELKKFIRTKLKMEKSVDIEIEEFLRDENASCIVITTNPDYPQIQEAFHLCIQRDICYLNSLGKFASDTLSIIDKKHDSVIFSKKNHNDLSWELIKVKFNKSEIDLNILRRTKEKCEEYMHEGNLFLFENRRKIMTLDESSNIVLVDEGEGWDDENTVFQEINTKLYQITPNEKKKEYCIYTFKKNKEKYERVLTNASSRDYIHQIMPDEKDFTKILAYRTGSLSQLTWQFCDKDFEKEMLSLSKKIQSDLGDYGKYSWHFSRFPEEKSIEMNSNGFSSSVLKCGAIKFDDFILEKNGEESRISCGFSGIWDPDSVKGLTFIPRPKPKNMTIRDKEDYPIDYAVFLSPEFQNSAAPTVMIIEGGPHVFIEYELFRERINFFNKNGYHVVIPQGLFRLGYPPEHALKSWGEFGELDMEQLRCILRDLKDQSITSGPVNIMGASYGGYSCARLAHDLDLVKCVVVENAFLDLLKGTVRDEICAAPQKLDS